MDQQRHAEPRHAFEYRRDAVVVGHAKGRVGRRARGVELDRGEHALLIPPRDLLRVGLVGQIAGHQRPEAPSPSLPRARAACGEDAFPIGPRRRCARHRRQQIRHNYCACELARGEREHRGEHFPVSEMNMPIIRQPQGYALRALCHLLSPTACLLCEGLG